MSGIYSACGVASVAAGSGRGRATVPLTSFNAWRRVGHYRSPQTAPEGVEGGRERREVRIRRGEGESESDSKADTRGTV
ncbi:hypothetical protein [Oryza sativa Japonica Group]|uniref:Uncharacterized protein n=1 Tax=Oryza sativa subsp. japonica TaxID=39947 RepID=Q9LDR0_ORYSJ|nr:hypothetical protein [Oryza sativa Japonica Group]BAB07921.1 hypothetical protein [Oryza sativa Japonica Group]